VLDAVQRVGFAGVNVTFPFKQAVVPLLNELSPQAAAIGAVNTVAFRNGRRIGYNTDVTGFGHAFADTMAGAPMDRVLQLGCGGAGSATAHALLSEIGVAHLILTDTDPARAEALRAQLAAAYGEARVAISTDAAQTAASVDWHGQIPRPPHRRRGLAAAPLGIGNHLFPARNAFVESRTSPRVSHHVRTRHGCGSSG